MRVHTYVELAFDAWAQVQGRYPQLLIVNTLGLAPLLWPVPFPETIDR